MQAAITTQSMAHDELGGPDGPCAHSGGFIWAVFGPFYRNFTGTVIYNNYLLGDFRFVAEIG